MFSYLDLERLTASSTANSLLGDPAVCGILVLMLCVSDLDDAGVDELELASSASWFL